MTDHQQPLTETQALAWLHGQPDGTIAITVSNLARCWGWNRSTTSRRVKVWVAAGQLVRTPRARTVVPFSQREHPTCHRCATPRRLYLVASEISRYSNGEPACAIFCTRRTSPGRDHAARRIADCRSPNNACRGRRGSSGARGGGGLVRNPDQCLVWRHARPHPRGQHSALRSERLGRCSGADLPTTARTLWTDRRRMAAAVAWASRHHDRGRPHGHGRLCRAQHCGHDRGTGQDRDRAWRA